MTLRKALCALFLMGLIALTLTLSIAAEDGEAVTMPHAYADMADSLPPEISDLLPDGLFSEDLEEALTATAELTDWRYLMNALLSAVGLRLDAMMGLFCTLVGLILLAAIINRLREGLGGGGGEILGFCLRLTLYTAIVVQTAGMVETVRVFYDRLTTLTGGMVPVMGVLYALGGNLGRAAVKGDLR